MAARARRRRPAAAVTHELPLADYAQAFALLESGEACKIVLYPGGAAVQGGAARPAGELEEAGLPRPGRWAHR